MSYYCILKEIYSKHLIELKKRLNYSNNLCKEMQNKKGKTKSNLIMSTKS